MAYPQSTERESKSRPSGLEHQKQYFESLGTDYAQGYQETIPFLERIYAAASPWVRGDVLDIGNGGLAEWDIARADRAVFVDLSVKSLLAPHTIADGKLRPLNEQESARVGVVGGNVLALPFADDSFDTVVMIYVAHHLSVGSRRASRANVATALAEARRVLRPDGRMVFLENIPSHPMKFAQEAGFWVGFRTMARFGKPLPYFLSRAQIHRLTREAGFTIHKETRIAWEPRVHQPLFPSWAPPGWLWEGLLRNRMFFLEPTPGS